MDKFDSCLVSVCLPVFNGEQFLADAITCVLNQTLDAFELVIVDDASTDATAEIARCFAKNDKRIKFHRNEANLGIFANHNRSMDLSRGKYIKPLAHDDLWDASILGKMVPVLENYPDVVLVTCARELIDERGDHIRVQRSFKEDCAVDGKEVALALLSTFFNSVGEPAAFMFRREQRGEGFLPSLPQLGDIEFCARILQNGNLFALSDVLCKYRIQRNSQSFRNIASLNYLADMLEVRDRYQHLLATQGFSREAFDESVVQNAIGLINYGTYGACIDFEQADYSALQERPRALGNFLVALIRRLDKSLKESSSLKDQCNRLASGLD